MRKIGSFNGFIKLVTSFAKLHSPELLVGLGIAGMATTTIMAVKATPKASKKIEVAISDANDKLIDNAFESSISEYVPVTKLKPIEVITLCWKDYAPAAITGVASIVCIIGGTKINLKRNAALITAVKLSEFTITDLQRYKKKVVETIGQEKNDEIEAVVDKERVEYAAIDLDSAVISGTGPILYFDGIGGQWFRSDKETVRAAINRVNFNMNSYMYVSLNDLYDELNMPHTVAGSQLGWNVDKGLIEPRFSSQLLPSGIAVVVLTTRLEPQTNYGALY